MKFRIAYLFTAMSLMMATVAVAAHFLFWQDDFLLSGNSGVAKVIRVPHSGILFAAALSVALLAWAAFCTRRVEVRILAIIITLGLYLSATTVVVTLLGGSAYNVIALVVRTDRFQLMAPGGTAAFTRCRSFGPFTTFVIAGKNETLWTGYWPFKLMLAQYNPYLDKCQTGESLDWNAPTSNFPFVDVRFHARRPSQCCGLDHGPANDTRSNLLQLGPELWCLRPNRSESRVRGRF